jgi:antitoxin HicB
VTDARGRNKAVIEPLGDEDGGGFPATAPELPRCLSDGETRAEALANFEDAIAAWIHCARQAGEPIPEVQLHRAA